MVLVEVLLEILGNQSPGQMTADNSVEVCSALDREVGTKKVSDHSLEEHCRVCCGGGGWSSLGDRDVVLLPSPCSERQSLSQRRQCKPLFERNYLEGNFESF